MINITYTYAGKLVSMNQTHKKDHVLYLFNGNYIFNRVY